MSTILAERLDKLTELKTGAHRSPDNGMCAMEAAAWIAGEPHSDHPACVDPVIAAFMRSWNDSLPDAERTTLLRPLIPKTIGTAGSTALSERRSLMAADWLVRVHTVAWLRLAGLDTSAAALASLPEITSMAQVPSIRGPIEAARDAARAAAWDAARAAAEAAAEAAAWAAAWVAAWDAARTAAGAAAWDAARAAAGAAASQNLAATRSELQASAVTLVERMCALEAA